MDANPPEKRSALCIISPLLSIAQLVLCSIVVSQWTGMLDIIQFHLQENGISFSRIDGAYVDLLEVCLCVHHVDIVVGYRVNPKERQLRMVEFNSPRKNPTVRKCGQLA